MQLAYKLLVESFFSYLSFIVLRIFLEEKYQVKQEIVQVQMEFGTSNMDADQTRVEVGLILGLRVLVPVAPFMVSSQIQTMMIKMVVFGLGLSLGGLDLHQGMAGAPTIMVVMIGWVQARTRVRARTAPLYWIWIQQARRP